MNPTANKSDFEDLTTNLRDLAYSYLEKYSPSKQQLKVYLLKKYLTKIKGTKSKKEVTAIIDEIILNLEKNKILNDELYSDSKARMFLLAPCDPFALASSNHIREYIGSSITPVPTAYIKPKLFIKLLLPFQYGSISPIPSFCINILESKQGLQSTFTSKPTL